MTEHAQVPVVNSLLAAHRDELIAFAARRAGQQLAAELHEIARRHGHAAKA